MTRHRLAQSACSAQRCSVCWLPLSGKLPKGSPALPLQSCWWGNICCCLPLRTAGGQSPPPACCHELQCQCRSYIQAQQKHGMLKIYVYNGSSNECIKVRLYNDKERYMQAVGLRAGRSRKSMDGPIWVHTPRLAARQCPLCKYCPLCAFA